MPILCLLGMVLVSSSALVFGDTGQKGVIAIVQDSDGRYARYLPKADPEGVLVIVHGMVDRDDGNITIDLAKKFLERWTGFAEKYRLIALAPAFENENFGSVGGPGGGYRGLFGRHIDADVFVDHLVDQYKGRVRGWNGRFILYGHSAGGQFANRYCVRHPDRILAAAISAPGGYAMPDPAIEWPGGMRRLKRTMQWSPTDPRRRVVVTPDPAGWLEAATLPIAVVVGADDNVPDGSGDSHVDKARKWFGDMRALAQRHNRQFRMTLTIVPKVGHNSKALTPTCQEALARGMAVARATRVAAVAGASSDSARHPQASSSMPQDRSE